MAANGAILDTPGGWSNAAARIALEMATYDGLPPEVRVALANAPRPMLSGEVLDEWHSAQRRGITPKEFAGWIG